LSSLFAKIFGIVGAKKKNKKSKKGVAIKKKKV